MLQPSFSASPNRCTFLSDQSQMLDAPFLSQSLVDRYILGCHRHCTLLLHEVRLGNEIHAQVDMLRAHYRMPRELSFGQVATKMCQRYKIVSHRYTYKAVKIVKAVQNIDAFRMIPGPTLCRKQSFRLGVLVCQSHESDFRIKIRGVPSCICNGSILIVEQVVYDERS